MQAFFFNKKNERKRRKGLCLLTKQTGPTKTRVVKVMLEACCGGARPGHERRGEDDGGGGLRTMHLIDLPNGHLKIDPDGEKKKKLRRRLRVCF